MKNKVKKQIITIEKTLKEKAKAERRIWEIKPVTRVVESKKSYNRKKEKQKIKKETRDYDRDIKKLMFVS